MTNAASQPPDYRVGNALLLLSEFCDFCRMAGVDGTTYGAISDIAHESYRAICKRGARVGELVTALEASRVGAGPGAALLDLSDGKVASTAMWFAARAKSARRAGVGVDLLGRVEELAEAVFTAMQRGASSRDVVTTLRSVRQHGSIGKDLPSLKHWDDDE